MNRYKTWIICADQHVPWHDKQIHKGFCTFLKDFKPDGFVIDGDFIDMYSISRHITGIKDLENADKMMIKLKQEFDSANSVLDDYDAALPKGVDKHFLDGN